MIEEQSSSSINYLIVINVYDFFTLKKTLKRPFKAILKSFKLLLIFYRIHFIFSFFTLHTLQPRTRKSYPHFHKPFKFAILRGCSSLFTYTVFLILLFLLQYVYKFLNRKIQKYYRIFHGSIFNIPLNYLNRICILILKNIYLIKLDKV